MKFLDQAKIYIASGKGGKGCVSFRREKYIEYGGPNGGDGGKGGDIVFITDPNLNTLIDFRYQQHFKAKKGADGRGKNQTGVNGKNLKYLTMLTVLGKRPANRIVINEFTTIGSIWPNAQLLRGNKLSGSALALQARAAARQQLCSASSPAALPGMRDI